MTSLRHSFGPGRAILLTGLAAALIGIPACGGGAGSTAILTLTNCIDGTIGGTVAFAVQSYTSGATLPNRDVPYLAARIEIELSGTVDGEVETTTARLLVRAFRDANTVAFRYWNPDAFWSVVEGGQRSTLACFDFAVAFTDGIAVFGDRRVIHDTYGVFVNAQNRLFSMLGFGVDPELVFGEHSGGLTLTSGAGLTLYPEVSRARCAVVGAPDGITPGTGNMRLFPDAAVLDGVVLRLHDTTEVPTTWGAILDD